MSEEVVKPDQPTPDPEPEGAIEIDVQGQKQKMVSVDVLAAERRRVRESTESKLKSEMETLKAQAEKAAKLEADLATLQPHLEYIKANPDLLKKQEPPEIQKISDDEAERFARDYELYSAQGLDLGKAKRMIAANRAEARRVAAEAAQEAIKPIVATTAQQQSRQNFAWAAHEARSRGVDPQAVAQVWAQIPPELSQYPEVAQLLLRASIGDAALSGKAMPRAPQQEPIFTEGPGGNRQGPYQMSELEKRIAHVAGVKEDAWTAKAKEYQPDAVNSLED